MPGEPDAIYVLARRTLLDAIDALGAHRENVVLIGAQAIYLRTRDVDLGTAPFTTDADFAVDPAELSDSPRIDDAMGAAGFTPRDGPGGWISRDRVLVDLLVPESLAGKGRRGADLGAHGDKRARRARGLEGVLIDRQRHTVNALDPSDARVVTIWVAGPGALLVAKIHKIEERIPQSRTEDKDALDVLRLLRGVGMADLAARLTMLRSSTLAGPVTEHALTQVSALFGARDAPGVAMAVTAADDDADPETVAASMVALATDLVDACG